MPAGSCRCRTIETGVLDAEMDRQSAGLDAAYEAVDDNARLALASHLAESNRTLDFLSRYEARTRRGFDRALRNLIQLQAARSQRGGETGTPGDMESPQTLPETSKNEILPNEPETADTAV